MKLWCGDFFTINQNSQGGTKMKKLNTKTKKEIQKFIKENQPKMDWYGVDFDKKTIEDILEKGLDNYIAELCEYNIEYIGEMEGYLIKEIQEQWDEYDQDELLEFSRGFICVDMNIKKLLDNLPDITCLAYVYSNYDCCNSFDTMETSEYLSDVYQRVKVGIKKEDYLWEFQNGAYGGCVFCFAFKTDMETFWELKEKEKTGKTITIPKGTQFGFFSSFQGAGTMFEKTTYRNMVLPLVGETEYDTVTIIPDIQQSYSMADVYGNTEFVDDGNVTITL